MAVLAAITFVAPAEAQAEDLVWTDANGSLGIANFQNRELAKRQAVERSRQAGDRVSSMAIWAACGWRDPSSKVVRLFQRDRRRDFILRCGDANFGYRHIKAGHQDDFERMAAGTYLSWRDVADLSMASNSSDPDVTRAAGGNQTCRSRVIFLVNIRNGQTVRQQIVRMFTDNGNSNIRSAFPSRHCV